MNEDQTVDWVITTFSDQALSLATLAVVPVARAFIEVRREQNLSSRRRVSSTGKGWKWGPNNHKGLEELWDYKQL